jgi:hypothetical protein
MDIEDAYKRLVKAINTKIYSPENIRSLADDYNIVQEIFDCLEYLHKHANKTLYMKEQSDVYYELLGMGYERDRTSYSPSHGFITLSPIRYKNVIVRKHSMLTNKYILEIGSIEEFFEGEELLSYIREHGHYDTEIENLP